MPASFADIVRRHGYGGGRYNRTDAAVLGILNSISQAGQGFQRIWRNYQLHKQQDLLNQQKALTDEAVEIYSQDPSLTQDAVLDRLSVKELPPGTRAQISRALSSYAQGQVAFRQIQEFEKRRKELQTPEGAARKVNEAWKNALDAPRTKDLPMDLAVGEALKSKDMRDAVTAAFDPMVEGSLGQQIRDASEDKERWEKITRYRKKLTPELQKQMMQAGLLQAADEYQWREAPGDQGFWPNVEDITETMFSDPVRGHNYMAAATYKGFNEKITEPAGKTLSMYHASMPAQYFQQWIEETPDPHGVLQRYQEAGAAGFKPTDEYYKPVGARVDKRTESLYLEGAPEGFTVPAEKVSERMAQALPQHRFMLKELGVPIGEPVKKADLPNYLQSIPADYTRIVRRGGSAELPSDLPGVTLPRGDRGLVHMVQGVQGEQPLSAAAEAVRYGQRESSIHLSPEERTKRLLELLLRLRLGQKGAAVQPPRTYIPPAYMHELIE